MRSLFLLIICLFSFSCVSVPKEAADMSREIGHQLQNLEQSHSVLVHKYFDHKKAEIRAFIQEEWVPLFAENFFSQPAIAQAWNQVVESNDEEMRLEFITMVAPQMQIQIDKAYRNLSEPIENLEAQLLQSLTEEYDYTFLMNQSLTEYLDAAAKTTEIRQHYLQKVGLGEKRFDLILDQVDYWTDQALKGGEKLEDLENQFMEYKSKIENLLSHF